MKTETNIVLSAESNCGQSSFWCFFYGVSSWLKNAPARASFKTKSTARVCESKTCATPKRTKDATVALFVGVLIDRQPFALSTLRGGNLGPRGDNKPVILLGLSQRVGEARSFYGGVA